MERAGRSPATAPDGASAAAGGVYLHLPFCPYLCPYCDFAKEPWRASRERRYLAALAREIDAAPAFRARTLFVGGGTPNMTAPDDVAALVTRARRRFALPEGAEVTVEVNPDPARRGGFAAYVAAGVTRLSIGAQSLVDAELVALGRGHVAADVAATVAAARAAGVATVSLDLIFAIPGQSVASLEATLDAATALEVDHVSAYGLTIEEGTPFAGRFARDPGAFVDEETEASLYETVVARLEAAGYAQYEISNFARPGRRCAHNAGYWGNDDYLGLGVGAASYLGGRRWVKTKSIDAYCAAIERGEPAPTDSDERLAGAQRAGEAAMLALRRSEGIDLDAFDRRYGVAVLSAYRREIAELGADGLLEQGGGRLRLTPRGRALANGVCAAFLRDADEAA